MVINNMIKLICVADFSSHYFKGISSISTEVEQVINKDSRLDINATKEEQPDLNNVLQEIKKTRTRINRHQNNEKESLKQKTTDDFSLIGVTKIDAACCYLSRASPSHSSLGKRAQWTLQ